MFSQKLLYRIAYFRTMNNNKIKRDVNSTVMNCEYCGSKYHNFNNYLEHLQKCEEKKIFLNNTYNCICMEKKFLAEESRIEHEKKCNDNDISELIIEDDWLELLRFYENDIKHLRVNYKNAFDKVKHLRNKKILILLNKISDESVRFKNYLNDKTVEYPSSYSSRLSLRDFEILN